MSAVCARNAAKSRDGSTRVLAISNAHAPGEMSDAELDYEGYLLNPEGFLYDSIEAPDGVSVELPIEDEAAVIAALAWCRGDSKWLDIDRLTAEIKDPRTPRNMVRRFYFNQLAAGANDYLSKPVDYDVLINMVALWSARR